MRPFEWLPVLRENGVPFVERGPNVKRGHVNIRCPFCGAADPSHHMGLELDTGYWGCWRNSMHRGKSPVRLLAKLLNIPYHRARQIAGVGDTWVDPEGFDAVADRLLRQGGYDTLKHIRREFLKMDPELKPVLEAGRAGERVFSYLIQRRFSNRGARDACQFYDLRTATSGQWRDRLVLPYKQDGELVAWTGRAIAQANIRYLDLPLDECLVPIKHTLYNHDAMLDGGLALVLVEGPIDALKLDIYGRDHGVRAVALSTNTCSPEQMFLLEAGAAYFNRVAVMMDNAGQLSLVDGLRMKAQLSSIPRLMLTPVPYGAKDAGDLTPFQAYGWAEQLSRSIRREV